MMTAAMIVQRRLWMMFQYSRNLKSVSCAGAANEPSIPGQGQGAGGRSRAWGWRRNVWDNQPLRVHNRVPWRVDARRRLLKIDRLRWQKFTPGVPLSQQE